MTSSPAEQPRSFAHMLLQRVEATPTAEAYRYRVGDGWQSLSWQQTFDRVSAIAAGLLELGVEPEDRVAIASATRMEWVLVDLAVMCAGAATTTVYPSTTADEVEFIVSDSRSTVVVAEDIGQLAKLRQADLPDVRTIVLIDPPAPGDEQHGSDLGERVTTLEAITLLGRARLERDRLAVRARIDQLTPEHLATLIYTSGTTGRPKGVRLVHANWVYEALAVEQLQILDDTDLQFLWLPLSHVFGKMLIAFQLRIGFATAVDGDLDRIVDSLKAVRPTFMCGAPRIFEKVRSRVTVTALSAGGLKARTYTWAFAVGTSAFRARRDGRRLGPALRVQLALADRLVFRTIRSVVGGRIRFFVSGSAKLSSEVAEWFAAAGLMILEGYGLTETSAAAFVNVPRDVRIGTVGPPLPGTEVITAADGEILVRGGGVMRGYHNLPESTHEVLDADGWFHTGDLGEVVDGYLTVTDRKKDLIKTSGGKYVAPQKIETLFQATSHVTAQVIVHGDGRKFVSALIALDPEAITQWAQSNGLAGRSLEQLAQDPKVRDMVQRDVDAVNAQLERWETVKRFAILPRDLSIDEGELTPSMKVRRRAVEKRYADVLDQLYLGLE